MTCNVHSLRYLPYVVRRLGSLRTTSCFALEDINEKIKSFVHGSKKPELQIAFNLHMHIKVHLLKHDSFEKTEMLINFAKLFIDV